ncbi:hypothetical protein ymoll0001_8460 [Yersinia mollaretii ATCC 43969]|uniref:Uncharacterized protein n=1 Tax=Yersinia mollaretii (strain ATCC 43969 / DSM 18520 / CIP 103324 / CNY 7263 / WAIP 204) TaxID=349967 RepID=A0ABM9YAB2_YERMW|nr:hypothetical protein ymoll0001_8460 [Yersinia mollaretii ATCC 43969]
MTLVKNRVVIGLKIVLNLSVVAYFRHRVESDEKLWDD